MLRSSILGVAATLLMTGAASAASIASSGDFLQIAQPATVTNSAPTSNTNILYFDELQNYMLTSDLTTDTGVISAGTYVDSHMFFLNRTGSQLLSKAGTLSFSNNILGTMSDINGALLAASDFLGAPTTYTNFNNRGLESNDTVFYSGNTITANMLNVTQPGDWVRVVTASVPVPASAALFPLGLFALGALRRRRKPRS